MGKRKGKKLFGVPPQAMVFGKPVKSKKTKSLFYDSW